jgi:hypothetical protein
VKPDPAKAEPGSMIEPPCGCRMWKQDDAFVIVPCSPGCWVFAYVRQASARRGGAYLELHRERPP